MKTDGSERYRIGERLLIWITGNTGDFVAEVVEGGTPEDPHLKLVDDPTWEPYTLREGDYIIRERLTC